MWGGLGVSVSAQGRGRHVLGRLLGALEGLVWAKRSTHVPVVLTRDEVVCVLDRLSGTPWLVVALLYGASLRSPADRLPVKLVTRRAGPHRRQPV